MLLPGHPRRELTLDVEALERVAKIADQLASLARTGYEGDGLPSGDGPVAPDPVAAKRIEAEAVVLRNYGRLCLAARDAVDGDGNPVERPD